MDRAGEWALSPAFDVTYSYNPDGDWTGRHQMTINGKRDGFSMEDFRKCAKSVSMKRGIADSTVEEVRSAISRWQEFAEAARVSSPWRNQIQANLRLEIL